VKPEPKCHALDPHNPGTSLTGEEKGYSRGHKTGFAEGVAVGALAVICAVVIGGVTMCLKFMNDE
jgi:hypothetical protein